MTVLESLREKGKPEIQWALSHSEIDPTIRKMVGLIVEYDLALENALLKLGNRSTQIKDLQHRIKILGDGLNAIRDSFFDTAKNSKQFIGEVETILNATKNKL